MQDRHHFAVDILLNVVLLEEEIETLTKRIEEFEAKQRDLKNKALDSASADAAELANTDAAAAEDVDKEQDEILAQFKSDLAR